MHTKKRNYSISDMILMGIYGFSLLGGIITVFTSEDGEMNQNINICIWITSSIMWYHLFNLAKGKLKRTNEIIQQPKNMVEMKALNSAPSNLSTYEKGIYEEAFKDGVNYIKTEVNKSNDL